MEDEMEQYRNRIERRRGDRRLKTERRSERRKHNQERFFDAELIGYLIFLTAAALALYLIMGL